LHGVARAWWSVATFALMPNDEPGGVAMDVGGRAHVALRRGGALVTIDVARGQILARRAACSAPRGVAYDASLDAVWMACAGGELLVFAAAGGAARTVTQLDRDLRDVVV